MTTEEIIKFIRGAITLVEFAQSEVALRAHLNYTRGMVAITSLQQTISRKDEQQLRDELDAVFKKRHEELRQQ